jgi:hypothetical protein
MAGASRVNRITIVITDPVTRDKVTYDLADLDAAQKFIEERLAEQKNGA